MTNEKDPLLSQLAAHIGGDKHRLLDAEGDEARGQPPTEAELAKPYAAPGTNALLKRGIVYQADWQPYGDGVARHAREVALALAAAGVPISLQPISTQSLLDSDTHPSVMRQVGHLRNITLDNALGAIRHTVLHDFESVHNLLIPKAARLVDPAIAEAMLARTIVYTSWERDRVDGRIADLLRRCAAVWVPCTTNAVVFRDMGIDKVDIIPFPYLPGDPMSRMAIPYVQGGAVPEGKRFYAIGKWEPRKNYAALVKAFLLAFRPTDKAALFIKTSNYGDWDGYPRSEAAVAAAFEDDRISRAWTPDQVRQRVRIVSRRVSEKDLRGIHAKNNIYVSASHGEAWDIPAFEACCAGNRLVHVGWGGSHDYAPPGSVQVQCAGLEAVPEQYGWEPDAQWARVPEEQLVSALQAATPLEERVHPSDFNGRFSRYAVGQLAKHRMIERLNLDVDTRRELMGTVPSYG